MTAGSDTPQPVWILPRERLDAGSLREAAASLGALDRLAGAHRIAIKPNLCAGGVIERGGLAATDAAVLRDVLVAVRALAPRADLAVVESDSIGPGLADDKFERQGYPDLIAGIDRCRLVNLSRSPVRKVPIEGRFFHGAVVLPTAVADADLVLSVSKAKTHAIAVVTGATKNLFGCLPETLKSVYHPFLPSVLFDLTRALPAWMSVVEFCPGMEGDGPIHGTPIDLGVVLVGGSPWIVDAAMVALMGRPAGTVPLLAAVSRWTGLRLDPGSLDLRGEPIDRHRKRFQFPSPERRAYVRGGLWMQRAGQRLSDLGHFVHNVRGTWWAARKAPRWLRRTLSGGR